MPSIGSSAFSGISPKTSVVCDEFLGRTTEKFSVSATVAFDVLPGAGEVLAAPSEAPGAPLGAPVSAMAPRPQLAPAALLRRPLPAQQLLMLGIRGIQAPAIEDHAYSSEI